MNYFNRNIPDKKKIEACLESIAREVDPIYDSKTKNDDFIRLHSSTLGKDEFLAFSKSILEGNITLGYYNSEYENLAKEIFQSEFCLTSNSGSSANLLAISSLVNSGKLNKGDKVIVPALAWSTTIFPLVQYGLIPVYVDCCSDTFNINNHEVIKCCQEHIIKGIMIIHTYGNPVDMGFLVDFCESKSIILIEDTCESMGASWNDKPVGSFGDLGTFSSYYSHHICTLEGGLTISKDKNLDDLMRSIRSHGWTRGIDFDLSNEITDGLDPNFLFLNLGYNLRLSDPQAAVGCIQLRKLDKFVKQRTLVAERYKENISNSPNLEENLKFPKILKEATSSWFGFPVLFPNISSAEVKKIRKKLLDSNVETRPFLAGDFSLQPVNKKFPHIRFNSLQNVELCHKNAFALPCHQDISMQDVDKVCSIIADFFTEPK